MKTKLLATLFATAMLGGCATYDYTGGSAPGGYYHGRPSVEYYGPYGGGYGYGYPAYGSYGSYVYGSYRFGSPYYRSPYAQYPRYVPYPVYRPRHPRPDHDHGRPRRGDGPPPWRSPDPRYQQHGGVGMAPDARSGPRGEGPRSSGQPGWRNPGHQGGGPRGQARGGPRGEQVGAASPAPRPQAQAAPAPRPSGAPTRQGRPAAVPRPRDGEVRPYD